MADKKKKNTNSKKSTKRDQSAKKSVKAAGCKVKPVGYSARIKLPNGKIMVAAASGLWDEKSFPDAIIIRTKEQALIVAKNLASAYGKGAKPSVRQVKKAAPATKKAPMKKASPKSTVRKVKRERYTAKEINGKGYIFDSKFSASAPIAVEKNYETAKKLVKRYNEED